jgi:hypothetical protein
MSNLKLYITIAFNEQLQIWRASNHHVYYNFRLNNTAVDL